MATHIEDDSDMLIPQDLAEGASRYLGKPLELLPDREKAIFRRLAARRTISADANAVSTRD